MRTTLSTTLKACIIAASLPAAWADGLQSLEHFMKSSQAGQAQFKQTVTSPAKEGQAARTKVSSGTFIFQRPGKFKFIYTQPFAQTIVADGQQLWLYDEDLNQVTQRRQADVLGSTPAALLASANTVRELQKSFALQAIPAQETSVPGLQWMEATPKVTDGQIKKVRIGFDGDHLAVMDILDNFGQRSTLHFTQMQIVPSLPAGTFHFEVPQGADVVQQ